ncbi:MAG: (5-formylfuran-3-yl)methyl phosphate synthase [Gemmatimonadales bacterium]
MRLLVSVQSVEEARIARAGGADIVDAKDPAQGALGPVGSGVLAEIRAALPGEVPVSAALGDVRSVAEVERALRDLPPGLAFVKLGFAGVDDPRLVEQLLSAAVEQAARQPGAPKVVAVAFADRASEGDLVPSAFPALIARSGAHGLLVDTARKQGGTLRDHLAPGALRLLGAALGERGLLYALGGSLSAEDVPLARSAGADVLGVRGAVTAGVRTDVIDGGRVAALAARVHGGLAASLH